MILSPSSDDSWSSSDDSSPPFDSFVENAIIVVSQVLP
jgi:hypothetical protein